MIGDFNEVFLMDWGLGMDTVTKIGAHPGIVGTPAYMAPEMLSGNPDDIDARTDVYLMGGTIHHLLIGEPRHNKRPCVKHWMMYRHPWHMIILLRSHLFLVILSILLVPELSHNDFNPSETCDSHLKMHWSIGRRIQITQRAEQASLNQFTRNVENVRSLDNIEISKQYFKNPNTLGKFD